MIPRPLWSLFAALVFLAPNAARAQPVQYSITALGTLGGTTSFALDINNVGQITGNAQTPVGQASPRLNGFLWQNGTMTNLGVLPGSNNFSRGYSINDSGVIVGESDNNSSRAFRWEGGTISPLVGLAAAGAVAHGINNAGVSVGISSNGTVSRPTRWSTAGTASDLGSPDGLTTTSGRAWAINNAGDAVGHARSTGFASNRAVLWQSGGGIVELGGLNATGFSEAFAVNASRQAVGAAVNGTTPSGTSIRRATLWQNGTVTDLGSLGLTFSEAKDINDGGTVVGFATNISGAPQRAFVWQAGVLTDLNALIPSGSGWTLTAAEGINDAGQIICYGSLGGNTQAYLLTPVPEPGSTMAVSCIVTALALYRRARRSTPNSSRASTVTTVSA